MKNSVKKLLYRALSEAASVNWLDSAAEKQALLLGKSLSWQVQSVQSIKSLSEIEFSVSSQWGEDGIIEWIVSKLDDIPKTFVEFGVEDYRESNTRFLLQNRNWRGLVIDGSHSNISAIRSSELSWRYDITAVKEFITRENINDIISKSGLLGDIGLLSIDIDGNDFWVWEAIECVSPQILIVEYNANFGDTQALSIPYRSNFFRTDAHSSNLYFGASCRALINLGERKGYTLLGSNLNGNNLFFIRDDVSHKVINNVLSSTPSISHFREARDLAGRLTLSRGMGRTDLIADMEVVNIETGVVGPLRSFGKLFSEEWQQC